MGTTVKLTNTEDEALIVAADYYSLQLDDYLYDFVAESGEFCWENTWICLTAGALIIEDGESLNEDDEMVNSFFLDEESL